MRSLRILVVAGSVAAVAGGAVAAKSFFGGSAVQVDAQAGKELTTGSVDARWPKPNEKTTTAPAAAMPQPQAVEATAQRAEKRVAANRPACSNPNALGVSRTIQLDTTDGPGLGMSQYRDYDFLQPGEVVLTFDDGPWPATTPAVLAALSAQCTLATFFPIGKHATWHPSILKQVIDQGHTVGSHTWSHKNLATIPLQDAKDEIEKGASAIALMAGAPIAPFFRFPQLRQSKDLKAYMAERHLAAFSIDVDSEDFRIHKPDALVTAVMKKLTKAGKGILLMHDLHKSTAGALPEILAQMKAGGFKIVHIRPKDMLETLPQYDAAIASEKTIKTTSNARPMSSVMKDIE